MDKIDSKLDNLCKKKDKFRKVGFVKPFKIQYYTCGEYRYKRTECSHKKSNTPPENPDRPRYKYCGLPEHSDTRCWGLPENARFRPED